jgi:hypothetical protein
VQRIAALRLHQFLFEGVSEVKPSWPSCLSGAHLHIISGTADGDLGPFTQRFRQPLLIGFKLNQSLIQFLLIRGPRAVVPRLPIVDADQRRYLFARLMSIDVPLKRATTYLKRSDCSRDMPVVLLNPGDPLVFGEKELQECARNLFVNEFRDLVE